MKDNLHIAGRHTALDIFRFAVFFCNFWQIFGFYRYIIAFLAILSVFLGIFSGIQDGVLPVAPIGE